MGFEDKNDVRKYASQDFLVKNILSVSCEQKKILSFNTMFFL